jgi:transcriptional regulator with GAF, ATPase, and Fis domain
LTISRPIAGPIAVARTAARGLPSPLPEMVGENPAMLELARMIRLVAPRSAAVLIEGETGTGKEVVAKAVHRLSTRASKAFVVLNCAAIPEALLEAELFGHARGAFTGAVQSRTGRIETADGGTLFLDEIGEMPLALQAKMLRFLECGELQRVGDNDVVRVDVRVIAATHQHLEQRAEEKTFRLDLYHRLAVFPLQVPALRERLDDLPLLVEYFLDRMSRNTPRKGITPSAMELLRLHSWPGNVRELMHVLERGSILAEDAADIGVAEIMLRSSRRPGDRLNT